MKDIVRVDKNTVSGVARDESDRKYTTFVKKDVTNLYDVNKRIRLEALMRRRQRVPVFGDDIAFSFSMPSNWKVILRQKCPDVLDLLLAKNPEDNLKGAQRLALLEPNWCTIAGNW